jgi:hypothetical protein
MPFVDEYNRISEFTKNFGGVLPYTSSTKSVKQLSLYSGEIHL